MKRLLKQLDVVLPVFVLTIVTFGFGLASFYAPPETGEMAVVFAPGTSEVDAVNAVIEAGGRLVGPSRFENIIVAYALDAGFSQRVTERGGLFTLAASGLCSPAPSNSTVQSQMT